MAGIGGIDKTNPVQRLLTETARINDRLGTEDTIDAETIYNQNIRDIEQNLMKELYQAHGQYSASIWNGVSAGGEKLDSVMISSAA